MKKMPRCKSIRVGRQLRGFYMTTLFLTTWNGLLLAANGVAKSGKTTLFWDKTSSLGASQTESTLSSEGRGLALLLSSYSVR